MVLSRWCEPSGLVGATVAGAITEADRRELASFVAAAIARFGEVRVLVGVERYSGRHHDARFDPDTLWDGRDGEGIARVAIIGEPAWKVIAPAASRHRRVPIEYFANEYAARCWLAGQTPEGAGRSWDARRVDRQMSR